MCILHENDSEKSTNYSELRNNLESYLNGVINDSKPLIVHRLGNENVVIISLEEIFCYDTYYPQR